MTNRDEAAQLPLWRVYFALGTDHFGRRLETSTARRAETKEEAIEMVVASGVAREAITGAGLDG